MKIAVIETFYGGSHRAFVDGLVRHTAADATLFTLPGRSWKWRLKTGAFELAQTIPDLPSYDLLFVTSLCNVAELQALVGRHGPPIILYMHENQLTYPRAQHQKQDFQIKWIDCMNVLTADYVVYNSATHRAAFLSAFATFLQTAPRTPVPVDRLVEQILRHSCVIPPGTDTPAVERPARPAGAPPRIVWNHRWEYDKQPRHFLQTLLRCDAAGYGFELILLGEGPAHAAGIDEPLIRKLAHRIVHRGYLEDRQAYFDLLATADIVISTAIQENFGLSIAEAIQCGCFPLLPDRLSYPEIIPEPYHDACLYPSDEQFFSALSALLETPSRPEPALQKAMACHQWKYRIADFDGLFRRLLNQ